MSTETEEKVTHTPGPWVIVADDYTGEMEIRREEEADAVMYEVIAQVGRDDIEGCVANAHLIRAAPDLLFAAQLALKYLSGEGHPHFTAREEDIEGYLRDAIAKAEGQEP